MFDRSLTTKSLRVSLSAAVLAGSVSVFMGTANAGIPLPDFCKTANAHATLNLGPGILGSQATSIGGNYFQPNTIGCNRFVVDIKVPYNSSGPAGFLPSGSIESGAIGLPGGITNYYGGFSIPSTKAECTSYLQYTSFYKKAQGQSAFSLVKSGKTTGTWNDTYAYCKLTSAPLYSDVSGFIPPSSGTDVYRVAVSVKVGGTYRTVRVKASHNANI